MIEPLLKSNSAKKVLISTAVVTVDNGHVFDKAAKKLETIVTILRIRAKKYLFYLKSWGIYCYQRHKPCF